MKKGKIGRKLGALALTGVIMTSTMLPCTVNATEVVKEDDSNVISGESVIKKGKRQGKKMRAKKQNSGDTTKKETLKLERKTKKQEKSQDDNQKKTVKSKLRGKKSNKNVTG